MIDHPSPSAEIDPEQEERQLFEQLQATNSELPAIAREMRSLDQRQADIVSDAAGGSVAERLQAVNDLQGRRADLTIRERLKQSEWLLLSPEAHRIQLKGRGRHAAELQQQITAIDNREIDLKAQIAELNRMLDAATEALEPLDEQRRALTQKIVELEPRTAKHLPRINVRLADPFRLPSGVLIKGTAWNQVITDARAAGVNDLQITVNEMTGEVEHSSLDDE